jgi:uncharacterized protein (TIGR02271 family)
MSIDPRMIQIGDDVIASDGEKIGSVTDIAENYLVAEKGFFFLHDYYVPFNVIARHDQNEGRVYLSVTKDQALESGWDEAPIGDTWASTNPLTDGAGTPMAAGMGATGGYAATGMADDYTTGTSTGLDADIDIDRRTDAAAGRRSRTDRVTDDDNIVVPVHEEDLIATKTTRQAGDVKVSKHVVEEDRELDVPITEERVKVTRRTVDRVADTGDTTFTEDTFEVPVRTEDVNVDKVTRVAGEIEIEKEKVQTNKRVSGTVRKEVVDVDEAGDVTSNFAGDDTRGGANI